MDLEVAFDQLRDRVQEQPGARQALNRLKARLLPGHAEPFRIGRYVVIDTLGRGAMGVVFAAYDPQLERRVAIKLLAGPGHDARRQDRLLREGRAIARLSDPNVVAVYDAGVHDGQVFLAMELVQGPTLDQWLRAGRSRRSIMSVMLGAGTGLAAAHRAQIVHRDFKPDNVIIEVGDDERARVVDFGLARRSAHDGDRVQQSVVAGTPAYAAPEQTAGADIGPAADQYSFCVVTVEALTGQRPGPDAELLDLPRPLRRALARGLRHDPSSRFETMDALLAALRTGGIRRWWWLGVALTGVAAAVTASVPSDDGCVHDPGAITHRLSPATHAAIEARFVALDPDGRDAWFRASTELERWTERWNTSAAQGCSVVHSACLAHHRQHYWALLDVFDQPEDRAVVQRAAEAVQALPPPEECLAPHPARRWIDNANGATQPEQVRVVARALALDSAGRTDQAWDTIEAYLEQEPDLDPYVMARITALRANLAHRRYDAERARVLATEAIEQGASSGNAWAEADGWRYLVHALCWGDKQFELAQQAIVGLRAAHLRLGDPPLSRVHYHRAVALVAHFSGRHDEAVEHYRHALTILREYDLVAASTKSSLQQGLAVSLLRTGDYLEAEAMHRTMLEALEKRSGPHHPNVALARASVAQNIDALGRSREARDLYRSSISSLEATFGPEHASLTIPLLNLSRIEIELEDERGLETLARYEALVSRLPPEHPEHGRVVLTRAREAIRRGDAIEGLALAKTALEYAERNLGSDHFRGAYARGLVARALDLVGRFDEALIEHGHAIAAVEEAYDPDDPSLPTYLSARGRTALRAGRVEEAARDFDRAYTVARITPGQDQSRLEAATGLAEVELRRGNPAAARRRLEPQLTPVNADIAAAVNRRARDTLARAVRALDATEPMDEGGVR